MNIGDLVKFHVNSWVFHRAKEDYASPGIIISQDTTGKSPLYEIMWADSKVTREHPCYLRLVGKRDTTKKSVL